jgi:hypothetical protein
MGKLPYRPRRIRWHWGVEGKIRWLKKLSKNSSGLLKSNGEVQICTGPTREEQASTLLHEMVHGAQAPVRLAIDDLEETIVLTLEMNLRELVRQNPDLWHWMVDAIAGRLPKE